MKTFKKFFALLLTLILTLTCGLIACKENNDDDTPTAGYRIVNDYKGKTAEQIYAEAFSISNQKNFSYSVKYQITRTISLAGQGTSTHYMWLTKSLKKADSNIHFEQINNLGRLYTGVTEYEDQGKFVKNSTLLNGTRYDYSATLYTQGDIQQTHAPKREKTQSTYEQFVENLGATESSLLNPLYGFTTENFKDVKIYVNKLDANDVYFTLSINGDKSKEFTKALLAEALMRDATPTSNTEVTYFIMLTEDGKFEKAKVSFKIQEGSSPAIIYSYSGEISFSDVGSTTVSAPEDANDYVEK